MISVASISNTSCVLCDPRLVSYALEQSERLDKSCQSLKGHAQFILDPLYEVMNLLTSALMHMITLGWFGSNRNFFTLDFNPFKVH